MKTNPSALLLASAILCVGCMTSHGQWTRWEASAGGNGHWYQPVRVTSPISWATALTNAQSEGGYLASITSAAENAFVFNLIDSPQYWTGDNGPLLGGYQFDRSMEPAGGWSWVSGEPWGFTNWASGQPDNLNATTEEGLHFWNARMGGRKPLWNDFPTNWNDFISYVVERETPPPLAANIRVSQVEISWESATNATYQVQYRSELTANLWVPLTTNAIVGTGGTSVVRDDVPGDSPRRFYRIVENP